MLPGVDTQEWLEVTGHGVLVQAGDHAQDAGALVLDQPGPPTALNTGQGGICLLLQGLDGAEVAVNSFLYAELSLVSLVARWCCRLPELSGSWYYHGPTRTLAAQAQNVRTLSSPSGSPPPSLLAGAKFSQKRLWFR